MAAGPLAGVRVLEVASEYTAFAGQLLAWCGAEVLVVEPSGGSTTRKIGPFARTVDGASLSLWWEYYNQGKRSITLDLDLPDAEHSFQQLLADADLVLEGATPGALARTRCDWEDLRSEHPRLIWVSVTPFGRNTSRTGEPVTDLTLMAGGGPMWNCGYDDHRLPPMRGGEGFAAQIGAYAAVHGALVAHLHRLRTGRGQLVDVSIHAALNVTTEQATYEWLVGRATVQRQTGRHASPVVTQRTQSRARDGRYVNTGVPAGDAKTCQLLLDWLDERNLRDQFTDAVVLELGATGGLDSSDDAVRLELLGVQRGCASFLAEHYDANDYFHDLQKRGLAGGVINTVGDVLVDPHFRARGALVDRHDEQLQRSVSVAGPPMRFASHVVEAQPAPLPGQHSGWHDRSPVTMTTGNDG